MKQAVDLEVLEHDVHNHEVKDPRFLSDVHLAQLGVVRLNKYDTLLQCMHCGRTWTPQLDAQGLLPAGYWVCPEKCNC